MAAGFNSKKLIQIFGDGKEYLRDHTVEFDVIITDSSDPIGLMLSSLSKFLCIVMVMCFRSSSDSVY